jgi:diguanylate cyclase (GGDEF)-like protein
MDPVTPGGADSDIGLAGSRRQRASLSIQVDSLQATLVRLLQDIVDAESRLNDTQAAQLVEANEQLMLAALANLEKADTSAAALHEAEQMATLDALTGLPNRHTLLDRFAQAVAQSRRRGNLIALLFVDLDNFKPLNDRHGHAFGDRVLRLVAERLATAVREGDTVSRHGGDEFLILLADIRQPADAHAVAAKLSAALTEPAALDGQDLQLSASVGVAIYPEHGENLDALAAFADAAMYKAKRSRRGAYEAAQRGPGARADRLDPGVAAAAAAAAAAAPADQAPEALRRLADLREANERLVLAALSAQELLDAADRARQQQSEFMAAVAAELGNPLAPIRIATSMLGRLTGEEPLLPRVRHAIEQQMALMSGLVGRLVEASANEGARLVLEQASVDMVEVVQAAIAVYRPVLQRHRLRLNWHAPAGPVVTVGDAARLQQIVTNLLDHACAHTPNGGRIDVVLASDDDKLTLTVLDTGLGIPPQALPEVFEPFVLDLHALDFNGVGLGVGLTVARALVQAHGGSISAHSDGVRRGSRFVIALPLATAVPGEPQPPVTSQVQQAPPTAAGNGV